MRRPRLATAMLRDAALVAAIAVLCVQVLRRWIGDRYLVPTGSMEPVFHGHPEHGDIVFVSKCASAGSQRRRDLVVVQHPSEPGQQMVQRIAARGDDRDACWIDIRQGDVWLGPDEQRMQREQKDPLQARGQRVLWSQGTAPGNDDERLDTHSLVATAGGFSLPAMSSLVDARTLFTSASRAARRRSGQDRLLPAGFFGTRKPVDATFMDAAGGRIEAGRDAAVTDVSMELDLAAVGGDVLATIETRGEALTFHWQPSTGRVVLWRDGVEVAATTLPNGERAQQLEFGLLDDRAFFCLDGEREQLFVVPRRPEWVDRGGGLPVGARTLAYVGVVATADAATLIVTGWRVLHDVFAWRESIIGLPGQAGTWPRFVRPDEWFLLGDSAFDSRDSRHFGAVAATTFLGVPCCVLGPWPRSRWVRP